MDWEKGQGEGREGKGREGKGREGGRSIELDDVVVVRV